MTSWIVAVLPFDGRSGSGGGATSIRRITGFGNRGSAAILPPSFRVALNGLLLLSVLCRGWLPVSTPAFPQCGAIPFGGVLFGRLRWVQHGLGFGEIADQGDRLPLGSVPFLDHAGCFGGDVLPAVRTFGQRHRAALALRGVSTFLAAACPVLQRLLFVVLYVPSWVRPSRS